MFIDDDKYVHLHNHNIFEYVQIFTQAVSYPDSYAVYIFLYFVLKMKFFLII